MNRIKDLRIKKGISQLELAKVLGIKSRTYLSMIENGSRPISYKLAKKLADYFGVSLEDILGSDAIKENYRHSLNNKSLFAVSLKDSVNTYEEGLKEYNSKFLHFLLPIKHSKEEFKKDEKLFLIVNALDSYFPLLTSNDLDECYHLISKYLIDKEAEKQDEDIIND